MPYIHNRVGIKVDPQIKTIIAVGLPRRIFQCSYKCAGNDAVRSDERKPINICRVHDHGFTTPDENWLLGAEKISINVFS